MMGYEHVTGAYDPVRRAEQHQDRLAAQRAHAASFGEDRAAYDELERAVVSPDKIGVEHALTQMDKALALLGEMVSRVAATFSTVLSPEQDAEVAAGRPQAVDPPSSEVTSRIRNQVDRVHLITSMLGETCDRADL